MRIKFSSLEIEGDILPHDNNELDQYKDIAYYIYDVASNSSFTDITIDDKLLFFSSIFTSKLFEGIIDNIYGYLTSNKGSKYLSGDATMSISEALTYATFNSLYEVSFSNIIPFRSVKYLGTIVDAMIDLNKERKLREKIGAEGGFLFINIRSTMSPRSYYVVDKLMKSLKNLEIVRYPNNYGLISLIVKDEYFKEIFIFIKP